MLYIGCFLITFNEVCLYDSGFLLIIRRRRRKEYKKIFDIFLRVSILKLKLFRGNRGQRSILGIKKYLRE